MYITARTSDTFLATNSPNVTAGFICPPTPKVTRLTSILSFSLHLYSLYTRDAGSAVNEDEDHAAEGPGDAEKADAGAGGGVRGDLVANDGGDGDVEEEEGGDELRDNGAIEGPFSELIDVNEGNGRRVGIVLGAELAPPLVRYMSHGSTSTKMEMSFTYA